MKFKTNKLSLKVIIASAMLAASLPALAVTGDTDQPIHIESDTQSLDMQGNVVTFTGNVVMTQGTIKINADKVVLTGKKSERERIYWHTGYPGGIKSVKMGEMLAKKPERLFERVVKGMLPKTRLDYIRKLKVYAGPNHPHAAQMPEKLED